MPNQFLIFLKSLFNLKGEKKGWALAILVIFYFGWRDNRHADEKQLLMDLVESTRKHTDSIIAEKDRRNDLNNERIVNMSFQMIDVLREGTRQIQQKDSIIQNKEK
jgi:hypothetical protein